MIIFLIFPTRGEVSQIDFFLRRLYGLFTGGGNRSVPLMTTIENLDKFNLLTPAEFYISDDADIEASFFGPYIEYGIIGGIVYNLYLLAFFIKNNFIFYTFIFKS